MCLVNFLPSTHSLLSKKKKKTLADAFVQVMVWYRIIELDEVI